jgi:hypothetical protein
LASLLTYFRRQLTFAFRLQSLVLHSPNLAYRDFLNNYT